MKVVLFILVHFRLIWAHKYFGIFGAPINLFWFVKWLLQPSRPSVSEFKKYLKQCSLEDIRHIYNNYHYKADPLSGAIDYDDTLTTFLMRSGDCDDFATLAKKVAPGGYRIAIYDRARGIQSMHVDYFVKTNIGFALSNYGNPVYGVSIEDCIDKLCRKWYSINSSRVIYCRIFY